MGLECETPFRYLKLGLAALHAGDARSASELFRKELGSDPDYQETHFWLAVALLMLGQSDKARGISPWP